MTLGNCEKPSMLSVKAEKVGTYVSLDTYNGNKVYAPIYLRSLKKEPWFSSINLRSLSQFMQSLQI